MFIPSLNRLNMILEMSEAQSIIMGGDDAITTAVKVVEDEGNLKKDPKH